jgi:predicted AAA+ superfamily ATPase
MRRAYYLEQITFQLKIHTLCGLLGARQVGKTTLAREYSKKVDLPVLFFDLENPADLARLENPMQTLEDVTKTLIIIDEIQLRPNLFPVLRVLADQHEKGRKFLILGSASRDLIRQSSETLAGRIGYIELPPFSLIETKNEKTLWLRGGFPPSYLAETDEISFAWRQAYIKTFLERDIPQLGFQIPSEHIRRFWLMLSHYHGQILNSSELARSLQISDHTVRRYIDILVGTFMVRQLHPWFENISKRQVKSPKIYLRDSGILHALLGIRDFNELHTYPKIGAFWEGFALEEIIKQYHASEESYFWATQSGAELDLLIVKEGKKMGFEFKYVDAPRITSSMRIASETLKLDHLYLVYPGQHTFPLADDMTALGIKGLHEFLQK